MASWMVHLRIADILADELNVDLTEFIVGNLAPDSGKILNDGTYSPPSEVTHWKTNRDNHLINPDAFYKVYSVSFRNNAKAFYLGYYSHLITDFYWHEFIVELCETNGWQRHDNKFRHLIYSWNYNVDMIFFRQNPKMRAFNVLMNINEFENIYLHYFSKDAMIDKMKDICNVYNNDFKPEHESKYITTETIDLFISNTVEIIRSKIRAFYDDSFVDSTQALC